MVMRGNPIGVQVQRLNYSGHSFTVENILKFVPKKYREIFPRFTKNCLFMNPYLNKLVSCFYKYEN